MALEIVVELAAVGSAAPGCVRLPGWAVVAVAGILAGSKELRKLRQGQKG